MTLCQLPDFHFSAVELLFGRFFFTFYPFFAYNKSMIINLKASKRDIYGKALKKERLNGSLPVIVYGYKQEAMPLFVGMVEFKKALKDAGESTLVNLSIDDEITKDILINDVQYHPVLGEPIHADFYVVQQDKAIEVEVPLVFEGEAPAVKDLGGNLVKVLHELTVEALPKNLPHDLKVDISVLAGLDSQILVKDIKMPAGVTALAEPEEVICSITEAGEEVAEEEAPVDLSTIEVEKKGKEEEGEDESTGGEK